jgi:hypothetical protein
MMVRVPSSLSGLGQDSTDYGIDPTYVDSELGSTDSVTPVVLSPGSVGPLLPGETIAPGASITTTVPASLQDLTSGSTAPTSSQLQQVVQQGTSSGLSANQIAAIVQAASAVGTKVLQVTNQPSLIPGTNLVYNPATGQILPSGTTLSSVFGSATLSSGGTLLLVGGGILLLVLLMGKK